jgi:hypothetical protein
MVPLTARTTATTATISHKFLLMTTSLAGRRGYHYGPGWAMRSAGSLIRSNLPQETQPLAARTVVTAVARTIAMTADDRQIFLTIWIPPVELHMLDITPWKCRPKMGDASPLSL